MFELLKSYTGIDLKFILKLLFIHYYLTRLCLEFLFLNLFFICGRIYNKTFWKKVEGKWIVITGCTDGIGKEIALQLNKPKNKLCLVARNESKLNDLADSLSNCEIKKICFDFKNEVTDNLFDDLDEIGLLINNAGISSDFPNFYEESNVKEIIQTNVLTTANLTKLAIKKMNNGSIIFVSSILAENTAPLLSCYSASKAFIKHLSESIYFEGKNHAEVVFPGYVCSKMSKIRKESFFIPSSGKFANALLKTIGFSRYTVPYYPHLLINFFYKNMPMWLFGNVMLRKLLFVRNLALRKKKTN